ncbi:hypothetical protein [Promicromonospora iranensis]|uniref:Uncharacterized protein n=1 Tax=Promicromonospora iranensis TaxID=1105144 RepID=A0ABU2CK48_9MICO|nr:hypothetical protein [Promicromonospora iranensis]MDR7381711.1 hypothetical protein [Promicromonospora iranensis]
MIIDADGPWTAVARLVVDREQRGEEHGVTDDGATFCGLSPDLVEVYRHPFSGRGRSDCRTCARRLYEVAGLPGKEPTPAAWARPLLRWTAWVTNGADAAMVTDALRQVLTGRAVTAVRYADLDYESEHPYWHEGDRDTVGHGLELDLDDGSTWSVIWEQQGHSTGLGISAEPLIPNHLHQARIWNVTRHWRRRGPRTISQIETFWWPERPPGDSGPSSALSLGGLVLHDFDRDRQASVVIDEHFDVRIYFSPSRARRDGYFTDNYVSL